MKSLSGVSRSFLRAGLFVSLLGQGVLVGCSCGGASSAPTVVATVPPAPSPVAIVAPSVVPKPAHPLRGFDPTKVTALTSRPELAEVATALEKKDSRGARDALEKVLEKLSGVDLERGRFLLARLEQSLGRDAESLAQYEKVGEASGLTPYATLRRAGLLLKKKAFADAKTTLASVPDVEPFAVDRHILLGDALAAEGDHVRAADSYRAEKDGIRAAEARVRFAEEVLLTDKPDDKLLDEASALVRIVRFKYAHTNFATRAEDAETRLLAKRLLPPIAPTAEERLLMAQVLLDHGRAREANGVIAKLVPSAAQSCRHATITARSAERMADRKSASELSAVATLLAEVAKVCDDENTRATALYDAAKLLAGKHGDETRALSLYEMVEKTFPKHRFADDARLRRAVLLIEHGDAKIGEPLLDKLADDFPTGDLRGDGTFRLALPKMKRGDWKGARPLLEASVKAMPHDEGYFVVGRSGYFLGRAEIETGDTEAGLSRLLGVIAEEPLSFSSAMAYAEVCRLGKCELAKKTLTNAMAAEAPGLPFDGERSELTSPAFQRALAFATVLEPEAARKELGLAGLLKDPEKDPGGLYVSASVVAIAGDIRGAHNLLRNRTNDWSKHFPNGAYRMVWDLAYPRLHREIVAEAAAREGVPAGLICAVTREESAFDASAVSPSKAFGLMQLIEPTAKHYAKALKRTITAKDLFDPDLNIQLGTAYLRKLRGDFPKNPGLCVPSYNAGEGATQRWLKTPLAPTFDLWVESIPYEETRKYTKRVLVSYFAYVALHEPDKLGEVLQQSAGL